MGLRSWLRGFRLNWFTESLAPSAVTAPPPSEVSAEDVAGRFLTESGHLKPQRRWRGIDPPFDRERGRFETSVSRIGGLPDAAVWGLAAEVERTRAKAVLARLDMPIKAITDEGLRVVQDEPPVRHAVILGWPSGFDDADKAKRKLLAQALAASASFQAR